MTQSTTQSGNNVLVFLSIEYVLIPSMNFQIFMNQTHYYFRCIKSNSNIALISLCNIASQYSYTLVFYATGLKCGVLSLPCLSLDLRLLLCSRALAGSPGASDSTDSAFLAQDLEPYLR